MTNEQAIEVLQSLRRKFLPSMKVEKGAIDMAIEALRNETLHGEQIVYDYDKLRELI